MVLASVVHLADYMTQKLNIGAFYWDKDIELDETVIETLKFDNREKLEEFIEGYKELFEREAESLQI